MSWVFLTDDHAYKLKKPVRHDRLDYTTLAARRRCCEFEVELNRRMAATVYLGAVPLTDASGGRLLLRGRGEVVEWLVWMRRLAVDHMLDVQILRGGVDEAGVQRAASKLAEFHRRAPPMGIDAAAYRLRLATVISDWRAELCLPRYGLPRGQVNGLAASLLEMVRELSELIDARAARVVEGHGDLRPQHVCLEAEPVFIDCLEFDRELRMVDPVAELAFLWLECDRLGGHTVGQRFVDAYVALTGDEPAPELMELYRGMHAGVRALLAARHTDDAQVDGHAAWLDRARQYLRLAACAS